MPPDGAPRREHARTLRDLVLIACLCGLFFGWRLGRLPLIDPDEPFYALSTSEMLAAHDWMAPRIFGHPQFEKPPVVYWLMMLSTSALGRNELAERLPMAVAATLLVFAVYAFGARHFGRRAALLAAVILATGVEFMVTARLVLTDMIFALFTGLAAFSFWLGARDVARRTAWWLGAALCASLAVLTKGPLGILVPGLAAAVAWVSGKVPRRPIGGTILAGFAVFAAVAVPWYVAMTARFGVGFLRAFLVHENWERLVRAEHGVNDHWFYYLAVLIAGSLPWWPALAIAVVRARGDGARDSTVAFLWGWIVANLAFFTIAHSKLPTYVLFCFPPLALIAGQAVAGRAGDAPGVGAAGWWARGAGVTQALLFAGATLVPLLAPLRTTIALVAAILMVGLVPLWRGRWQAWAVSTVAASATLVVALLTVNAGWVESMTSTRAPALAVAARRTPGEPLVCEPSQARGLTYYSGLTPVVLARNPHPWFTPHPLPVVVGPEGLGAFVRQRGPTLCLVRTHRWSLFSAGVPPGWTATSLLGGEASLFLIAPPGAQAPPVGRADQLRWARISITSPTTPNTMSPSHAAR